MALALTDEQRRQMTAGDPQPAEVIDPHTHRRYVLVPLEDYQNLKEQRDQSNLRNTAARTLGRRLAEGG